MQRCSGFLLGNGPLNASRLKIDLPRRFRQYESGSDEPDKSGKARQRNEKERLRNEQSQNAQLSDSREEEKQGVRHQILTARIICDSAVERSARFVEKLGAFRQDLMPDPIPVRRNFVRFNSDVFGIHILCVPAEQVHSQRDDLVIS